MLKPNQQNVGATNQKSIAITHQALHLKRQLPFSTIVPDRLELKEYIMTGLLDSALESYTNFDGMLGRLDATIMALFLDYQHKNNITGPMVEFGVYKGKSAALLATYMGDDKLELVDVAPHLDKETLNKINDGYDFLLMDSAKFIKKHLKDQTKREYRFMHADGSHTFDNVYYDMANADALLADNGIFVLDDFYNPHYPQVAAAIYTYIERNDTDLKVFLVGSNKCYVCRTSFYKKIRKFLITDLQKQLKEWDAEVQLSKTDSHKQFDTFSFKAKPKGGDLEDHYGTHLYGHFYKL